MSQIPKIGINVVPLHHQVLVEGCELAESLGFESVWMGEHVLTPATDGSEYPGEKKPFDVDSPFLDPLVALGHVAARTTTLRLGTGVLMATMREPFVTIRALATLDALSGGRLDAGLGLGWSTEEYSIIGADWSTRAKRMEEFVEVLTLLFGPGVAEYDGETISMPRVGFGPKSPQGARPRIHLGGHTPRPLRRAALLADGWYGGSAAVPDAEQHVKTITALRAEAGMTMDGFECGVVMLHTPDRADLEYLASVGIHRVVITPWRRPDRPSFPGDVRDLRAIEDLARRISLGS